MAANQIVQCGGGWVESSAVSGQLYGTDGHAANDGCDFCRSAAWRSPLVKQGFSEVCIMTVRSQRGVIC